MATVHICDRCGAEINLYSINKHHVAIFDDYQMRGDIRYSYRDLCDNCRKILQFIMEDFIAECQSNQSILDFIGIDENGNDTKNNC